MDDFKTVSRRKVTFPTLDGVGQNVSENVVLVVYIRRHEYPVVCQSPKHFCGHVHHLCTAQNHLDGYIFHDHIETTILMDEMEGFDCTNVGSLAVQ